MSWNREGETQVKVVPGLQGRPPQGQPEPPCADCRYVWTCSAGQGLSRGWLHAFTFSSSWGRKLCGHNHFTFICTVLYVFPSVSPQRVFFFFAVAINLINHLVSVLHADEPLQTMPDKHGTLHPCPFGEKPPFSARQNNGGCFNCRILVISEKRPLR